MIIAISISHKPSEDIINPKNNLADPSDNRLHLGLSTRQGTWMKFKL
ncbi:hypothetical protein X792_05225 [Dehalococcoides mccartyi CG1]|nr:hypothetical protein X792_05225 [Dehalococcoides mccartyi CG1]